MLLFIEKAAVFQMPEDRFQYISCYSLSLAVHTVLQTKPRFNTSHVTLYQIYIFPGNMELICFNTSHVTLYRKVG